jgi:hypothetical protein
MFKDVHIEISSGREVHQSGPGVQRLKYRYRLSSATTQAWQQMVVDRFDEAIEPDQVTATVFVWGNNLDLVCCANDFDHCFARLLNTIEVTNQDYSTVREQDALNLKLPSIVH